MTNSEDATPYQKYFDKVPIVDHLRVIGCRSMVHIPIALRHKLQPKAEQCWFIGYRKNLKDCLFWNDETRKPIASRDAEFFENKITVEMQTNSKAAQCSSSQNQLK